MMWQTAPASLSPLPTSFPGRGRLYGSDVFDESIIDVAGTLISQQLSICDRCLPQEIVQAVGTTVRAAPPRADVLDQRPANACACGQRVQKWRFPFHDAGVGRHMRCGRITRLGDSSAWWWCGIPKESMWCEESCRPQRQGVILCPSWTLQ